ncbi:MAG: murein L,D-transpeptidase catalytic domain family protein [Pseudomonadota bacterium]
MPKLVCGLLLSVVFTALSSAVMASDPLAQALARAAPKAKAKVIALAVQAARCADARDGVSTSRLAVIDYSKPSTKPRLWVFDLASRRLMFEELVAHGRNSGDNYARHFSNQPDSLTSSLGLFRTRDTYEGQNGYSLRLAGLEPGTNDQAESRAIVMHGAPYVNTRFFKTTGRLGRSHGCPAVRTEIAQSLIDDLKDGQYLFAYYPDRAWLKTSSYLSCKASAAPTRVSAR